MASKDLPADVATWTNLHVAQWLLQRDQKTFVPLMRFSGEDMGEYTLKPEQFEKDKKEAKRILQKKGIIAVTQKKKLPNGGLARIDESSANLNVDVSTTRRGVGSASARGAV